MTAYEILGVPEHATTEEVAAACRRALFDHHPDRGGDPERFRLAARARDLVGDPAVRAAYDARLARLRARGDEVATNVGGEEKEARIARIAVTPELLRGARQVVDQLARDGLIDRRAAGVARAGIAVAEWVGVLSATTRKVR